MVFCWWTDDGQLIVVLYLDPLSPHQLKKNPKHVNVGPLLTKPSGSTHDTTSEDKVRHQVAS